jgi:hypothetical protein
LRGVMPRLAVLVDHLATTSEGMASRLPGT